METEGNQFHKSERVTRKIAIDKLFAPGNRSFAAFPLRAVYMKGEPHPAGEPSVTILISVSKKRFHGSVQRNRVKRQVREAYRLNRSLLGDLLQATDCSIVIAFIYLDSHLRAYCEIERSMKILLGRTAQMLK